MGMPEKNYHIIIRAILISLPGFTILGLEGQFFLLGTIILHCKLALPDAIEGMSLENVPQTFLPLFLVFAGQ